MAMRTQRGFERLINFSDAVVAIAVTLLVLPLVDLPAELSDEATLWDMFREAAPSLGSFLLSFVVIWRLWSVHHQTMEYFDRYNRTVVRLSFFWLLTIVVLPFPTELLSTPVNDRGGAAFYIAVLFFSSLSLELLNRVGKRHPELLRTDDPEVQAWLADKSGAADLVTSGLLFIAFVLSAALPQITSWPLLLLLLDGIITRLLKKRRASARKGANPTP